MYVYGTHTVRIGIPQEKENKQRNFENNLITIC